MSSSPQNYKAIANTLYKIYAYKVVVFNLGGN